MKIFYLSIISVFTFFIFLSTSYSSEWISSDISWRINVLECDWSKINNKIFLDKSWTSQKCYKIESNSDKSITLSLYFTEVLFKDWKTFCAEEKDNRPTFLENIKFYDNIKWKYFNKFTYNIKPGESINENVLIKLWENIFGSQKSLKYCFITEFLWKKIDNKNLKRNDDSIVWSIDLKIRKAKVMEVFPWEPWVISDNIDELNTEIQKIEENNIELNSASSEKTSNYNILLLVLIIESFIVVLLFVIFLNNKKYKK
jgi:hypothetical protein